MNYNSYEKYSMCVSNNLTTTIKIWWHGFSKNREHILAINSSYNHLETLQCIECQTRMGFIPILFKLSNEHIMRFIENTPGIVVSK